MKTIVLIFTCLPWLLHAQWIGTPTVVPASPTTADPVQIILETMTPNQGHKLQRSAAVTKTGLITIEICNYSGMLTAIQMYLDTFQIGQLPAGTWSVDVNYSIAANAGVCTPASQSVSAAVFTIAAVTGEREIKIPSIGIFPNPANENIEISSAWLGVITVFDVHGRLLMSVMKEREKVEMDLTGLAEGVYLLRAEGVELRPVKLMVER